MVSIIHQDKKVLIAKELEAIYFGQNLLKYLDSIGLEIKNHSIFFVLFYHFDGVKVTEIAAIVISYLKTPKAYCQ